MRLEKSCSHASCLIQGSAPADAMCDLCPAQARCPQHPLALLHQRARHGQAWESRRAPQHLAAPALIFCPLLAQEELVNNTELVQSLPAADRQCGATSSTSSYSSTCTTAAGTWTSTGPGTVPNAKTLRCPVMLVVGDNAPAEEGVVDCNSKLDPTNTTFLKMADSGGLPQVTQPGKLTEAFKYFLQGMGYIAHLKDRRLSGGTVPSASMTRLARSRTASLTSASSVDSARPRACTHSESTEAMGQINHTMEVSC
uniref:NDRG family member 4 n=1 Tax=Anas platyrhynchos TaxID=8839 RepID=A0A8B9SUP8_ANAPL